MNYELRILSKIRNSFSFFNSIETLLLQNASKSYALSAQDFSLLPLKSRVKIAEDER